MKPTVSLLAFSLLPALAATAPVPEQLENPKFSDVEVVGHVLQPPKQNLPLTQLRLPPGFRIEVFARDLINPRMLAVADDGSVYVTRRSVGDVLMLRDTDGDGQADQRRVVARRPNLHGIAIDGDNVWLVTIKELYRTRLQPDGGFGPLERLIDDLPDAGQHPNRTLAVGPDGQLYLSVGSTCNACGEDNPENATLLKVSPDGKQRSVFASGLRNTIGFGFEPQTGELYGMDHGIDWLGDNVQHEELNHIRQGHDYGWPYLYEDGKVNPADEPPGGIGVEAWARHSSAPVGLYVPHSAPMQMVFYTGSQFPEAYRGDAYVAMRGSWNRRPPSGYEVLRIRFEDGKPVAFEPFVSGFLTPQGNDGWAQSARLAGIAQDQDGALLLADDSGGVIYRIRYAGDGQPAAPSLEPTNAQGARVGMLENTVMNSDTPKPQSGLSRSLLEGGGATLQPRSTAFEAGRTIPDVHAAEGQNISPPLQWQAGPEGTRSYALIMEDPDAPKDTPFVHWLLYNLPAEVTALDEAIPGTPRLEQLQGALQGRNDRGTIGYYGPRPPEGDPAHHYHVQVFALDRMLDLPFGASRAELLEAMRGHVLGQGEVVGTYSR